VKDRVIEAVGDNGEKRWQARKPDGTPSNILHTTRHDALVEHDEWKRESENA